MRDAPPPPLASGTAGRVVYVLVAAVLALSSAAPFVRLGHGAPSVGAGDVAAALVYLATWAPFAVVVTAFARSALASRAWIALAGHALMLLAFPALHAIAFVAATDAWHGDGVHLARAASDLRVQVLALLGTLQYLVVAAALTAAVAGRSAERSLRRAVDLELARERLAAELARARVDALRAQLQPHFLFNTLNSIAVLATTDAPRARTMVRRLSELLRAVLAEDERPTVPLGREIDLLRAYVEIQRVRFGERVRVSIDAEPGALDVPVPTLILQPLLENAIRHAVGDREEGGSVAVSARVAGERLELAVTDDGPGEAAATAPDGARGVGLANTRGRLQALYGAAHTFAVGAAAGGGWSVRIAVPVAGPRASAA
ncbi:histidine kinase internal region (plasmid) [Gemmatirosa kalamazoonensis]|uniref:Histidine kinase internal region n=1 Tax=Gemmatirosa kalamazoonensis TaxID=861299 RepID=W0RTI2_9BACT|nr:histidine kinase [Gemmatirosa kalamazoonensis]AHG93752.1 histidine kinase internal region [Gemmatirosa kalamazoonensis]